MLVGDFLVEHLNRKSTLENLCFMRKHFLSDQSELIEFHSVDFGGLIFFFKKSANPNIVEKTIFVMKPSVSFLSSVVTVSIKIGFYSSIFIIEPHWSISSLN